MIARRNWSREELALALNLYCKLPFGQMHSKNKDIVHLADFIGRTPSAVAMKLCNFASLDSSLHQHGLASCSKLDKEVWKDFFSEGSLVIETEEKAEQIYHEQESFLNADYHADDVITTIKTRRMQGVLSKDHSFKLW